MLDLSANINSSLHEDQASFKDTFTEWTPLCVEVHATISNIRHWLLVFIVHLRLQYYCCYYPISVCKPLLAASRKK